MEKATMYDYVRMCNGIGNCTKCPLSIYSTKTKVFCNVFLREHPDKANEIILNWCEEHPIKTRQSEFLEMFPNVVLINVLINDEVISICPNIIDSQYGADCTRLTCDECRKKYWLAEVYGNE